MEWILFGKNTSYVVAETGCLKFRCSQWEILSIRDGSRDGLNNNLEFSRTSICWEILFVSVFTREYHRGCGENHHRFSACDVLLAADNFVATRRILKFSLCDTNFRRAFLNFLTFQLLLSPGAMAAVIFSFHLAVFFPSAHRSWNERSLPHKEATRAITYCWQFVFNGGRDSAQGSDKSLNKKRILRGRDNAQCQYRLPLHTSKPTVVGFSPPSESRRTLKAKNLPDKAQTRLCVAPS